MHLMGNLFCEEFPDALSPYTSEAGKRTCLPTIPILQFWNWTCTHLLPYTVWSLRGSSCFLSSIILSSESSIGHARTYIRLSGNICWKKLEMISYLCWDWKVDSRVGLCFAQFPLHKPAKWLSHRYLINVTAFSPEGWETHRVLIPSLITIQLASQGK